MSEINLVVVALLAVFMITWILTRSNLANILLYFPMAGILLYIIVTVNGSANKTDSDTWVVISCETALIGLFLISIIRLLKRA